MLAGQVWSQTTFTIDNLKYTVTNASKREVSVGCGDTSLVGTLVLKASVDNNGVTYTVTSIGANAFENCTDLVSVTIPNTVTKIGAGAFYNCSGLAPVLIPHSVKSIGGDAFYNVRRIVSDGMTTYGSPWGARDVLYFSDDPDDNGFIYSNATKTCISCYVGVGGDVTIPSIVTRIEDKAFYSCSNVESVTIPNSVTSIGWNLFENCTALT